MLSPLIACMGDCGKQLHPACAGISRNTSLNDAFRFLRILCPECLPEVNFASRLKKVEELVSNQADKLDRTLAHFQRIDSRMDLNESNLYDLEKSLAPNNLDNQISSHVTNDLKKFIKDSLRHMCDELTEATNPPMQHNDRQSFDLEPLIQPLERLAVAFDELADKQVSLTASIDRLTNEHKAVRPCNIPQEFINDAVNAVADSSRSLLQQELSNYREAIDYALEHLTAVSSTPSVVFPVDTPLSAELHHALGNSGQQVTESVAGLNTDENYPPPNQRSNDGGYWLAIGPTRYWCRDLAELKRKKIKVKRTEKRRKARRTARRRKSATLPRTVTTPNPPSAQWHSAGQRERRVSLLHCDGFPCHTSIPAVKNFVAQRTGCSNVVITRSTNSRSQQSFVIRIPSFFSKLVASPFFWMPFCGGVVTRELPGLTRSDPDFHKH